MLLLHLRLYMDVVSRSEEQQGEQPAAAPAY